MLCQTAMSRKQEFHQLFEESFDELDEEIGNSVRESSPTLSVKSFKSYKRQMSASISIPASIPKTCERYEEDSLDLISPSPLSKTAPIIPPSSQSVQSFTSDSLDDTPISRSSSFSNYISRKVKNSFSKIIPKGMISRTTPVESNFTSHVTNDDESEIFEPENQKIVKESIKRGMPLIPFSLPTFYLTEKRAELSRARLRKDSIKKRQIDDTEDSVFDDSTHESEDDLPETIPQMENPRKKTERLGSYVEMDPKHNIVPPFMSQSDYNPYVDMRGMNSGCDEGIFDFEDTLSEEKFKELDRRKPAQIYSDTLPDSPYGHFQELLHPRYRKKGNRHKNDYAFLDFEPKSDYYSLGAHSKKCNLKRRLLSKLSSTR